MTVIDLSGQLDDIRGGKKSALKERSLLLWTLLPLTTCSLRPAPSVNAWI